MFDNDRNSASGSSSMFTIVKKEKKDKKDKKDKREKSTLAADEIGGIGSNTVTVDPTFGLGAHAAAGAADFFSSSATTTSNVFSTSSFEIPASHIEIQALHPTSNIANSSSNDFDFDHQSKKIPVEASSLMTGHLMPNTSSITANNHNLLESHVSTKVIDPLMAKLLGKEQPSAADATANAEVSSSARNESTSKFAAAMMKANAQRQARLDTAAANKLRREGTDTADDGSSAKIRPIVTEAYRTWLADNDRKQALAAAKGLRTNSSPEDEGEEEEWLGTALNLNEEDDRFYYQRNTQQPTTSSATKSDPKLAVPTNTTSLSNSSVINLRQPHLEAAQISEKVSANLETTNEANTKQQTIDSPTLGDEAKKEYNVNQIQLSVAVRIRDLRAKRQREVEDALYTYSIGDALEEDHDRLKDASIRGLGLMDFWQRCSDSLMVQ